jgi:hydrogenase expression/formation protein HypE
MDEKNTFTLDCPLPHRDDERVQLAHGGGGTLTARLIDEVFLPAFDNPLLAGLGDGAVFNNPGGDLAFSTDSYVVQPLFFPGGDIGSLAINGTVNDLAMCGALPLYLSAGFIIEEGLPFADLRRVANSMGQAARQAGVQLVTGDTKVVDHGKADGLFVNTAGVGTVAAGAAVGPSRVQPGDAIVLSGDLGRHGMAVMAQREGLEFDSPILSDCAPLHGHIEALRAANVELHCLRDLTRGGLAAAVCEIAIQRHLRLEIVEDRVPVTDPVRGACELLGLDPLHVANEGRFVAFVPADQAQTACDALRRYAPDDGATIIGSASETTDGLVLLESAIGVQRILERLSGEQLPRIC